MRSGKTSMKLSTVENSPPRPPKDHTEELFMHEQYNDTIADHGAFKGLRDDLPSLPPQPLHHHDYNYPGSSLMKESPPRLLRRIDPGPTSPGRSHTVGCAVPRAVNGDSVEVNLDL